MPTSSLNSAARANSSREVESASVNGFPLSLESLEELSHTECILRLEANGVGRVAGVLDCRPYICPVNYVVHEGAIIVPNRHGSRLHKATDDSYAGSRDRQHRFHVSRRLDRARAGSFGPCDRSGRTHSHGTVCARRWADEARDCIVGSVWTRCEERGSAIDTRGSSPEFTEKNPNSRLCDTPLGGTMEEEHERLRRHPLQCPQRLG